MDAAKDRRSQSILAYLEGSDRSAHIARTRFNENLTITVSADMRRMPWKRFAQEASYQPLRGSPRIDNRGTSET